MARFKAELVEQYKPVGAGGSFFSLANDKDYETVRLMYNDMNDVELFSVHEIEVNGQTQWVNCLREYDEPVDKCPLCAAGNRLQVKMWVPLYIENTGEVKVWERGRTFVAQIESSARRFNPLVSTIFEIERNGKKGDQNTTYALVNVGRDDKQLSELPPLPEVVGGIVKEYTFDQLEEFLQTGNVPGQQNNAPQTRNPASDRRPASNANEQTVVRRTRSGQPATNVF